MSTISMIVREHAKTIREGIAWVIIWKVGRSWNAETVYLNTYSGIEGDEDAKMAQAILKQDPNAIIINSYYCREHFDENMSLAEMAYRIRYHYERNAVSRLKLKEIVKLPAESTENSEKDFENKGEHNSGICNTGDYNSGNRNIGNRNSGDSNSGDYNSGDYNIGNRNSGDFNKTNYSSGCFNTIEPKINLFNKLSEWTYRDWIKSKARQILFKMPSVTMSFVEFKDMTDEEKAAHPEAETMGGYLKNVDDFKLQNDWWRSLSEHDKKIVKSIPNFDAEIFKEITGITVE